MTAPVLVMPGNRVPVAPLRPPSAGSDDVARSFADLLDGNAAAGPAQPAPALSLWDEERPITSASPGPVALPVTLAVEPAASLPAFRDIRSWIAVHPDRFLHAVPVVPPSPLEPVRGGGVGTIQSWNAGDRFDALGMFGHHGAESGIATAVSIDGSAEAAAPPPSQAEASDPLDGWIPLPGQPAAAEVPEEVFGSAMSRPTAPIPHAATSLAATLIYSHIPEPAEPEEPSAVQRSARPLPRTLPPVPSSLGLQVAEVGGALSIAARAPGDAGELRRALERTAAEFGLDIAELRLNGVEQSTHIVSRIGGRHGSHTR